MAFFQVVTHGKLPKGDGFAFQKNVAIAAAHTSGAIAHIMPKSLGDTRDVKAHHLLVLLLRLRQVKKSIFSIDHSKKSVALLGGHNGQFLLNCAKSF